MKYLNKFRIYVIIVFAVFMLILLLILKFTALRNESFAVFGNSGYNEKTIIIDAGHGGLDGGTVGIDGTLEKSINLQIAYKLKSLLELYGYNVIMTRSEDDSIHDKNLMNTRQIKVSDIHNRENIIKKNPDALFISIHQNHFQDSTVNGAQVFYSKNNPLSIPLAENIQSSLKQNVQAENHRKIKKSGTEIYLLYHSTIPSVMVECGFMSNYNDLMNLKNEVYQRKLSACIADGIIKYFIEQDEKNGS